MAQNQFKAFIQGRQWGDAVRTFIDDATQDSDLPDASSWEQLEAYVKQKHAVDRVIADARYVWQRYQVEILGKLD